MRTPTNFCIFKNYDPSCCLYYRHYWFWHHYLNPHIVFRSFTRNSVKCFSSGLFKIILGFPIDFAIPNIAVLRNQNWLPDSFNFIVNPLGSCIQMLFNARIWLLPKPLTIFSFPIVKKFCELHKWDASQSHLNTLLNGKRTYLPIRSCDFEIVSVFFSLLFSFTLA